jgi:hypothetical protein
MMTEALTLAQLLSVVSDGGVIGLLLVVLVGGARAWWVWGWVYRASVRDRDMWRRLALSGTNLAERTLRLAEMQGGADEPLG